MRQMWKLWEGNARERSGGGRYLKRIKELEKEGNSLRFRRKHSPLNICRLLYYFSHHKIECFKSQQNLTTLQHVQRRPGEWRHLRTLSAAKLAALCYWLGAGRKGGGGGLNRSVALMHEVWWPLLVYQNEMIWSYTMLILEFRTRKYSSKILCF
jgi:hypothetical protein